MTENIIQMISIILTTTISIISVVIAVKSLKTTQKSIEEANRPYVVVYQEQIQVLANIRTYIVVKNFGKTGAVIESLTFEPNYYDAADKPAFKSLENTFIAPGQSIMTVASTNNLPSENGGITVATIKYKDTNQDYTEKISLNTQLIRELIFSKTNPSKSQSIESVITKTAEELLRRNI
ncbi:Uncharacterized protein BWINRASL_03517 [Bacillus mycoides]|nr:Uncharacterized protein BWINRASL_03517 [Bacillus mycoides]